MSADALRFLDLVFKAWEDEGLTTDLAVQKAKGPSKETVRNWRAAKDDRRAIPEPRDPSWEKTERAARWEEGSARRVWNGGNPRPLMLDLSALTPEQAQDTRDMVARFVEANQSRKSPPSQLHKEA